MEMKAISLPVFAKKHPSNYSPRLARGFAFVSTKAVLVRKKQTDFRDAQTKGSLV